MTSCHPTCAQRNCFHHSFITSKIANRSKYWPDTRFENFLCCMKMTEKMWPTLRKAIELHYQNMKMKLATVTVKW